MPFLDYGCCTYQFTFKFGQKNTQRCLNGSCGCQIYSSLFHLFLMIRVSFLVGLLIVLAYCFLGKRTLKCWSLEVGIIPASSFWFPDTWVLPFEDSIIQWSLSSNVYVLMDTCLCRGFSLNWKLSCDFVSLFGCFIRGSQLLGGIVWACRVAPSATPPLLWNRSLGLLQIM